MDNIPTAEEFFEQGGTYPELAIEFAKLHVKAALESASNNAVLYYDEVDKQSILDSYNLDDIK